jgi:hypothetical protein
LELDFYGEKVRRHDMGRPNNREKVQRYDMGRPIVTEEHIPPWAVEVTRQVTILNERLPTHIDWTERNIKDHENRLRQMEKFIWVAMGASSALGGTIGALITKMTAGG